VTSPRDEIDDWLGHEVTPLNPPPGSLDRIRHRARQRKRRQVVFTAVGCAIVLAAAVAVPQVIGQQAARTTSPPAASSQKTPSIGPTATPTASGTATPEGKGTQLQQHTYLSTTTSGTVPPADFRPTSVTVVGTGTGGLVGAVIGQAGPPCYNPKYCTSLAGTSNYGSSWYGVSAPVATGPDGAVGISQLRFANLTDGWAFGPALYETSQGGWPWQPVQTNGLRVTDLEATGQGATATALAIFASCTGSGIDFARDCTSFSLYSGAAGSTSWKPVTVPAAFQHMSTGQASSATLVISGSTGYLLTPTGYVLSGPVSGGAWTEAGKAPCQPGPAQANGQPADAQLAANQSQLLLACDSQSAGGTAQTTLYTSTDGATWKSAGVVPESGTATSLTSATSGQVILATTAGIYYSADGGTSWHLASFNQPVASGPRSGPSGGVSYVGMTTGTLGVAVPANANAAAIYVTTDGGKTWNSSPIAG
jgi:hypothetical protein